MRLFVPAVLSIRSWHKLWQCINRSCHSDQTDYPHPMLLLERVPNLLEHEPNGLVLVRSEEHTSELQSQSNLVCRLLLDKQNPHSPAHELALPPQPSRLAITAPELQQFHGSTAEHDALLAPRSSRRTRRAARSGPRCITH